MPVGLRLAAFWNDLDRGLGAGTEGTVGLALQEPELDQALLHRTHGLAVECHRLLAVADA